MTIHTKTNANVDQDMECAQEDLVPEKKLLQVGEKLMNRTKLLVTTTEVNTLKVVT